MKSNISFLQSEKIELNKHYIVYQKNKRFSLLKFLLLLAVMIFFAGQKAMGQWYVTSWVQKPPATVTVGDTYTLSANWTEEESNPVRIATGTPPPIVLASGTMNAFISSNVNVATISGSTLTIVGAGTATITAEYINGRVVAASIATTITAQQKVQSISWGQVLPVSYVGNAPITLTATASSGLPVTYTSSNTSVATVSGSTLNIVGAGMATITASQAGNAIYSAAANVSQNITIKVNQSITWNQLLSATYGDPPVTLNATANSGLPVTYTSSNATVTTVSGNVLTIVGAGTATITASQAGNTNYNAAANVTNTITVNKANQSITWNQPIAATYGDAPVTLTATANSGLPVTYTSSNTNVVTVSGNVLTIVGAGTATITANQTGDNNYNAAANVTNTITVNKANQTITWNQPIAATYGDAPVTLTATTNSGLPVTYTSSNTNVATVNGNTLTIISVGSATITASQAGDNNNNAAANVTNTITVNKVNQTITWNQTLSGTYGDAPVTLNAMASSGLPVTYISSNTNVATVNGNTLTIIGGGTATITVSQSGNTNYNPATDVSKTITINKTNQSIAVNQSFSCAYGNPPLILAAASSSGLPVTYESSNPNVLSVNGNTLTIVAPGTSVITAKQAGNPNYNTADDVTKTITVNQANQTIIWNQTALSVIYGDSTVRLNAFASSGLPVTYESNNTSVATISGDNALTIVGTGTVIITAKQAGNGNYSPATDVQKSFDVQKEEFTLNFDAGEGQVEPNSQPVYYGLAIGNLPEATRTGYNFDGWFTQPDGGGDQYTGNTIYLVKQNITLYAKWNIIASTYGVSIGTFAGGSISADKTDAQAGETVTLTITPDDGYELNTVSAYKTGDQSTAVVLNVPNVTTRTFVMPEYGVTITATFQKTADLSAVETAKSEIESATYSMAQTTANTETAVKDWIVSQVNTLIASTGITVSASDITLNGFTAAIGGTTENSGTNGGFSFTVSLTKGNSSLTTAVNSGAITATPYIAPSTYAVTLGSLVNGNVSVNPSTPSVAGTLITLTILPNDGYELDAISASKTGDESTSVALNVSDAATQTFVMPEYGVTVTATFKKTQDQLDKESLDVTNTAIKGGTYYIAQATGNTETDVKTWLVNTLNALWSQSYGVLFRSATSIIGDVTITALTPAVAGTETNPEGINGSFKFTVILSKGETSLTTGDIPGIIIATPFATEKRIELMQSDDLSVQVINMGNVVIDKLTLELSGSNADVFTLSDTTINNLAVGEDVDITLIPNAYLADGTYIAILTVSGDGLESQSIMLTHIVSNTGNGDIPHIKTLNAWAQNGRLFVNGLIINEPWSVYSLSGILIYRNIANSEEADIPLVVHSVYIVQSGQEIIKVKY